MNQNLSYEEENIQVMVSAFVKQKASWENTCQELLEELSLKCDVSVEQLQKIRCSYPDEVSNVDVNFEDYFLSLPEMSFSRHFIAVVQMMTKRNKIRSKFKIGLLQQIDDFIDGKSEYDKPLSFRQINALQQWKPIAIRDLL